MKTKEIEGFDKAGFAEWLKYRPSIIKNLADKLPPWKLYYMASSGHIVYLYSYSENNTITVIVSEEYNEFLLFERTVFGVDPDDLSEITTQ